jgi:hypothetical protein
VTVEAVRGRREVWLRGNIRPGVAAVVIVAIAAAVVITVAAATRLSPWVMGGLVAVAAIVVANAGIATWVVSRPRLARTGSMLEVRLAPWSVERVPLEVVECIFRGSDGIVRPGEEALEPQYRVGTLIVRLAERATPWHRRDTFRPWGEWKEGHLVIDGRWCEPLTIETVRDVASRLLDAKREVAVGSDR